MKKGVLTCLALASLPFLLIPQVALAKKTLTVWGPLEPQFKLMCEKFQKDNPGVTVRLLTGDLDKFYTMITAGMMPDLWGPWATPGIRADVNRNWATEIGSYIKRDAKEINLDDFFPGLMKNFRVGGKQYSLPIFSYADYYFYNTALYAQSGLQPPPIDADNRNWNWDRMLADAEKMTRRDSKGKITVAGTEINTWTQSEPNFFHIWGASQYGAEAMKTAVPQQTFWTSPEMIKALTKTWELMNKYRVANPSAGNFASGKVGSTMHAGPMVNTYMRTKNLKWAIAPLPWGETNSGTLWPDGWRISRVSKNKELAWKFIKFVCKPENMRYIVSDPKSMRVGSPAARKSVFKETLGKDIGKATGMSPDDVYKVHAAADEVGQVKLQELVCIHADLIPFWDPIFQGLWNNKYSPAQAAQKLQDVSNRQLPILFKRWVRNIKFTGAEKHM